MMAFVYIIAAVVLLGLCIFVHELGHLLGGKMVGIKARVFSLGYGKGFIKKQIGDTTYQVTLIPLGGYCLFYGEDPGEERQGTGFEFLSAHPLKRIVTVIMGPLFNLFFGVLIFFSMNLVGYDKESSRISIPEALMKGSQAAPAYSAGLRTGDKIIAIDKEPIDDFTGIQAAVFFSQGKDLVITVEREGKVLDFTVKPGELEGPGKYGIGVLPYGEEIIVAGIIPGSVAAKAGIQEMDVITALDGKPVKEVGAFIDYVNSRPGKEIEFSVKRKDTTIPMKVVPADAAIYSISEEKGGEAKASLNSESIKELAAKGTFRIEGDIIRSADDVARLQKLHEGKKIVIETGKKSISGYLSVQKKGMIGIYPALNPEMITVRHGVGRALAQSIIEPYQFIVMNLKGFAMMFSGKLNVRENLSGPIRIGKIAGDVAYYKGISAFVLLMAKISIILMVMNLLPIPVVDGGHLMFFTIEWIRGKPLSDRVMNGIQTVGTIFLIALGLFVILNDIYMLPVIQNLLE